MKVSEIKIRNFKRFKELTVSGLSERTKLVVLVGPNGCGKSSLFDAFYHYYKANSGAGHSGDEVYYRKQKEENFDWNQSVRISFFNNEKITSHNKDSMYFRTAHRSDPDFNIHQFTKIGNPYETVRFQRLIDDDRAVSQNYERLIHNTLSNVYSEDNDDLMVKELREKLIGKIRSSMNRVFSDLTLNNIGDPLNDGAFFFEKGSSKSFHYKNLSGGEKSAFDLLLDLIIKLEYYTNTIFLIDEPELHMHTRLQGKLIKELYTLIPDNSQLWITAHSLGVIAAVRDLEMHNHDHVAIFDFDRHDFDDECQISPAKTDRVYWEKFLSVALDDYSIKVVPKVIILCEGSPAGSRRKNFDADIYNRIFNAEFPDITFISGGSCTDLEKDDHIGYLLMKEILKTSSVYRLLDRDDKSELEIEEFQKKGFLTLRRRHIESYIFDDEVITKLVCLNSKAIAKTKIQEVIPETDDVFTRLFRNPDEDNLYFACKAKSLIEEEIIDISQKQKLQELWEESVGKIMNKAMDNKKAAIDRSVDRGNPRDDIKSASGEIYNELKQQLTLHQCGNNQVAFMRDTLAPLITQDMKVYSLLKAEIGLDKIYQL